MKKITSNIVVGGKSFRNATMLDFDEYKYEKDGITLGVNDYYARQVIGLEGGIASFNPIFANNTPAQISAVSAEIAKKGYTSGQVAEIYGWNLGDTIPITLLNNEVIEMQIIGINHDILSSDHTSKAGITLQMVNCLATRYAINSTNTNVGGYFGSDFVNNDLPVIYELLPKEWKVVIKLVDKKAANGGGTNYTETITQACRLFLPSAIEIEPNGYAQDYKNEGVQYEYWKSKTATNRVKKYDKNGDSITDTATIWWLRSCQNNDTEHMCSILTSGTLSTSYAKNTYGISFALCV